MEYKFEGKAICERCKKRFDWYCINLNLIPRNSGVVSISCSDSTLMGYSYTDQDGIPVFEGHCQHCGRVTRLPKETALSIPHKYYM